MSPGTRPSLHPGNTGRNGKPTPPTRPNGPSPSKNNVGQQTDSSGNRTLKRRPTSTVHHSNLKEEQIFGRSIVSMEIAQGIIFSEPVHRSGRIPEISQGPTKPIRKTGPAPPSHPECRTPVLAPFNALHPPPMEVRLLVLSEYPKRRADMKKTRLSRFRGVRKSSPSSSSKDPSIVWNLMGIYVKVVN